jgi:hypothetical protein
MINGFVGPRRSSLQKGDDPRGQHDDGEPAQRMRLQRPSDLSVEEQRNRPPQAASGTMVNPEPTRHTQIQVRVGVWIDRQRQVQKPGEPEEGFAGMTAE